ncbi:MAG: acyltransferase [Pseudomonadota bacterium]
MAAANRLLGLDALRMLLALGVLFYHYLWSGPTKGVLPIEPVELLFYGRYAVPVFFIISGFVIARSMARRNWYGFAVARIARLYPSLLFCATVTFVVLLLGNKPTMDTIMVYLGAISFFGIGFDHGQIDGSYWTLVYEWRFYAIVVLLMAVGASRVLPLLITAFSFAGLIVELGGVQEIGYLVPLYPYASFFAIGVLVALGISSGWKPWIHGLIAFNIVAAGFALPGSIQDILVDHVVHQSVWEGLIIAAVALMIFAIFYHLPIPDRLAGFVQLCGAMSYPLYLVHQVFGYRIIRKLHDFDVPPMLGVLAAVCACCAVAWVAARLVEPRLTPVLKTALTVERPIRRPA